MKKSELEGHILKIHRSIDAIVPQVRGIIDDGHREIAKKVDDHMRILGSQQRATVTAVRQLSRLLEQKEGIALPEDLVAAMSSSRVAPMVARKKKR